MRGGVAAALVLAAVAGGVVTGFGVDALTSARPRAAATPAPATPAPEKKGVEVEDPVLVANDDGGATLSATLVNHTDHALELGTAYGGVPEDGESPSLMLFRSGASFELEPGASMHIGDVGDAYRVRFGERVQVGSTQPITLDLSADEPWDDVNGLGLSAPVVARTSRHAHVADSGPNTDIEVTDGIIVVVPGQERAYLSGTVRSRIDDYSPELPTAQGPERREVAYRTQTSTGGPYAIVARAGEATHVGVTSPFLQGTGEGDYVMTSDVAVGEDIRVTFRFPSGDVRATFEVVQGRADGTI